MKYKILLKTLYSLVYLKRIAWWLGRRAFLVLAIFSGAIWRFAAYGGYKVDYWLKRAGFSRERAWWFKRDYLQATMLAALFICALPQTRLYASGENYLAGQQTVAYRVFAGTEGDYESIEELTPEASSRAAADWRSGTVTAVLVSNSSNDYGFEGDLGSLVAGGTAVFKPLIVPGAAISGETRRSIVEYAVNPGDSLSSIAYQFDVSVATILWENNLTLRSVIRPGDRLRVPPTSGVTHTIRKGDTVKKIASLYGAKADEIIKFNLLKENGADLVIGEKIMVPNGAKAEQRAVASASGSYSASRLAAPASSSQAPGASGFIWPSSAHTITQYYSWRHLGLDIAGPYGSPTYAARGGVVEVAQCGWNNGYGCYIIINHGDGLKTLYGHHSRLLVQVGEYIKTGETIGLMGNTGKVRGVTGIHLHFEVRVNGARVNPLKYVK